METTTIVKEIMDIIGFSVTVDIADYNRPSFGLGDNVYEFLEEELCHPMFEVEDILTNEHLPLYKVMLPTKIEIKDNLLSFAKDFLLKKGIVIENKSELGVFVILHELGHAHHLFVDMKGNVEDYNLKYHDSNQRVDYEIKTSVYDFEEMNILHRNKETEIYADDFAVLHFSNVIQILKDKEMLSL